MFARPTTRLQGMTPSLVSAKLDAFAPPSVITPVKVPPAGSVVTDTVAPKTKALNFMSFVPSSLRAQARMMETNTTRCCQMLSASSRLTRTTQSSCSCRAGVGRGDKHNRPRTRFGVATGLVVVGDLYGSGASGDQAIVGETPNLAASLFGIAEPNNVVIVESTRKRAIAGTINALIVSYYKLVFSLLKPSTQAMCRNILERFRRE
jgi:hypothetical protein